LVQKLYDGRGASILVEGVSQASLVVKVGQVEEVSVIPALQNQFDLLGKYLTAPIPYLGGYFL
jgi:hypothetical protein